MIAAILVALLMKCESALIQARNFALRCATLLVAITAPAAVDEAITKNLIDRAKTAFTNGNPDEAIALVTKAIEADPNRPEGYFVRARIFEDRRESAKALADYDQVLKLAPSTAGAWQSRGLVHFKLAYIKESISDFDEFLRLVPAQAPYHWQRGISLYYATRYEDGRKQFELHQTVNPNDVENAVWHFLCVARSDGVEKARASLIPIRGDPRVPMMEVHSLFAGRTGSEDVLKAAQGGEPAKADLKQRLFYAHLYLGLYFEVMGDETKSRDHIKKAAQEYGGTDYMSDVARVHLKVRGKENK